MQEVMKSRNQVCQQYYNSFHELDTYKDKLLQSGNPSQWGINFEQIKLTPEEVAKNKIVAKSLMLPSQNNVLREMKFIFGYFNNTLVKEITHMGDARAKRYILALSSLITEKTDMIVTQQNLFKHLKDVLTDYYQQLPEIASDFVETQNANEVNLDSPTISESSPIQNDTAETQVSSFKLV